MDLFDAVTTCKAMGFDSSDIIIDVALTAGKSIANVKADDYTTLKVLMRYLAISSYDSTMLIVNNTRHDYPDIDLRNVIWP